MRARDRKLSTSSKRLGSVTVAVCLEFFSQSAFAATPEGLARLLFLEEAAEFKGDVALCLSLDGADVAPAFLAGLVDVDRRFVQKSACTWVTDIDKGSYHTETGKKAYFVSVSRFKLLEEGAGEVQFNIGHHGLWGVFKTLEVREQGGEWRVVAVKKHVEA